ncbi:hypothetical protein [Rahnella perminowiae]|uniref:hypothetical protein n=1 Tax=Rahnella perminowiae TaxID=2816244 RepID=UPI001EE5FCC1|nr:hypothetical protein [Rahnella perminowiae]
MKITATILLLTLFSIGANARTCTENDAEAADIAVDNLNSWEAIHKNYIAYAQCDDGSIAEGNSEAVARLLVDKWPETVKLQSLISHDSGFEKYILRHIDSTLDTDDLNRIITLSSESCPAERQDLCSKIIAPKCREITFVINHRRQKYDLLPEFG